MRTQTLNTYVKEKLTSYYNKPLRFKELLKDSQTDSRLAELSQAYFLLKEEQEKANKFVLLTKEYYFVETFKMSDQKYVYQFDNQRKARKKINTLARKKLKYLFEVEKLSKYRVAKDLGTQQSNLNEFYVGYNNSKLNAQKVFAVYGF